MSYRPKMLWDPMPWPHVVVFYLGIPVLMSVMFGINHAGQARHMSIAMAIPYWLGLWVPFWLTLEVATRASALALRPWSAPLWLLLILGSGLAIWVSRSYVVWYLAQVRTWMPTSAVVVAPPAFSDAWRDIDRFLGFLGTPLFWTAINYYYDRVLGLPRYRGRLLELNEPAASDVRPAIKPSAPPAVAGTALALVSAKAAAGATGLQPAPILLQAAPAVTEPQAAPLFLLLPPTIGSDIIALQAEDHYVRVHTSQGSALVRYRFSDAIRDLEPFDGMRVHRSFWIRRSAIAHIDRGQRTWIAVLTDGQRVPVSMAFREALRSALTDTIARQPPKLGGGTGSSAALL